jgi:hypothetical protein
VQRLHLVGFTSELDGLIFSAATGARSGGYVVEVDADLLDAIREVLLRREARTGASRTPAPSLTLAPTGRPASGLTPKEIQARLRAGRTVAEVAFEAGVGEDWVRRLAPPVFAEQAQIVRRALATHPVSGDGGRAVVLGEAVAANLAARGMVLTNDELVAGWSAHQVRGSSWIVEYRQPGDGADPARWAFDSRQGTLEPLDGSAAALDGSAAIRDGAGERPPRRDAATTAAAPNPDVATAGDRPSRRGAATAAAAPGPDVATAATARKRRSGTAASKRVTAAAPQKAGSPRKAVASARPAVRAPGEGRLDL